MALLSSNNPRIRFLSRSPTFLRFAVSSSLRGAKLQSAVWLPFSWADRRNCWELRDEDHAEADIGAASAGIVEVAVRATAVPGIKESGASAHPARRTFIRSPGIAYMLLLLPIWAFPWRESVLQPTARRNGFARQCRTAMGRRFGSN